MADISHEFPFNNSPTISRSRAESRPGEETPSLSSRHHHHLDVRALAHAPSYESLHYPPQSQDSDEEYTSSVVSSQSSPAEERRKLFSTDGSSSSKVSLNYNITEDELQWKRNDYANHASISEQVIPISLHSDLHDDPHRRISEGGNKIRSYSQPRHPLHINERSLVEEQEEGEWPDEKGAWHGEEKKGASWRRRRRSIDKTTG